MSKSIDNFWTGLGVGIGLFSLFAGMAVLALVVSRPDPAQIECIRKGGEWVRRDANRAGHNGYYTCVPAPTKEKESDEPPEGTQPQEEERWATS